MTVERSRERTGAVLIGGMYMEIVLLMVRTYVDGRGVYANLS